MRRPDRVIVPDNYEHYERMEEARKIGKRLDALESRVQELESWILDK